MKLLRSFFLGFFSELKYSNFPRSLSHSYHFIPVDLIFYFTPLNISPCSEESWDCYPSGPRWPNSSSVHQVSVGDEAHSILAKSWQGPQGLHDEPLQGLQEHYRGVAGKPQEKKSLENLEKFVPSVLF